MANKVIRKKQAKLHQSQNRRKQKPNDLSFRASDDLSSHLQNTNGINFYPGRDKIRVEGADEGARNSNESCQIVSVKSDGKDGVAARQTNDASPAFAGHCNTETLLHETEMYLTPMTKNETDTKQGR